MGAVLRTQRRVLRTFPVDDRVARIAHEQRWEKTRDLPPDARLSRGREITWRLDAGLGVGYLVSHLSQDCWIFGLGEDVERADRLIRVVGARLLAEPCHPDELLSAMTTADTTVRRRQAVVRAALGAPLDFDPDLADAISAVARADPEARVRSAAVHGMRYTDWSAFAPVAERIANEDPDESVRTAAERVSRVLVASRARARGRARGRARTRDRSRARARAHVRAHARAHVQAPERARAYVRTGVHAAT